MSILHVVVSIGPGRHNDAEVSAYKFQKQRITIGNTTGNDIVIEHGLLSRHQCRISVEGARIFVTDLRTLNPTLVNNQRISTPTPLRPYDAVSFFGGHDDAPVLLRVYLDEGHLETPPTEAEVTELQVRQQWQLRKRSTHLQRLAASCPDLPAIILEELSWSHDLETLRCLAKNPNIHPSVLSKLAPCCTKEILQNPGFSLWLLEDLWLGQFSIEALVCLLSDEDVPVTLLSHLATHHEEKIRRVIASHVKATSEILAKLPIEEGSTIVGAILSHPACPLERFLALAQHGTIQQREMLTRSYTLPAPIAEILLVDAEEEVRWWLTKNHSLSASGFGVLATDLSLRVRLEAALHLHFRIDDPEFPQLCMIFARDPEPEVRLRAITIFAPPTEVLALLSEDPDPKVREQARRRQSKA